MVPEKVALVTGASRGIGARIALTLAQEGYAVGINYLKQKEGAQALARQIEELGGRCILLPADVGEKDQVKNMVESINSQWGRIDVLINNAGVNHDVRVVNMSEEQWDKVIKTNLKGTFLCSQRVAEIMYQYNTGSIINISSIVGLTGRIGQANYSTSKAEIIALTKAFALELAKVNIRVNAIIPAFIGSDMTRDLSQEAISNVLQTIPLGKLGSADDVARLIKFLVSSEMEYVTGQVFHADCRVV